MIGFWKSKFDSNFLGHKNGLNKEQIEFLQSLKEGDRLIVYTNTKKDRETQSDITLKLYKKAEAKVDEI